MPGGTSFYFAHAIKHLNANDFLLVTALADTDMGIVEDIRERSISVKALHSTHSVCFENIYGRKPERTYTTCHGKSRPFTVEGLKDTDARIIHLGSLLADASLGGHQVLVRKGTPLGRCAGISPQSG